MKLFGKKNNTMQIPEPFTADDIKIESSICTGEKTIGFYDKTTGRLLFSELVENVSDVRKFYSKYGLEPKNEVIK